MSPDWIKFDTQLIISVQLLKTKRKDSKVEKLSCVFKKKKMKQSTKRGLAGYETTTTTTTTTNFIENWKIITLFSHPQIAYKLIEAGGAEDITKQDLYIDGLNNSEDTTIQ